jgi:hypothetical protein
MRLVFTDGSLPLLDASTLVIMATPDASYVLRSAEVEGALQHWISHSIANSVAIMPGSTMTPNIDSKGSRVQNANDRSIPQWHAWLHFCQAPRGVYILPNDDFAQFSHRWNDFFLSHTSHANKVDRLSFVNRIHTGRYNRAIFGIVSVVDRNVHVFLALSCFSRQRQQSVLRVK